MEQTREITNAFVTKNMLQETADGFETQWSFPNCVGAIDGKHVRIRCPQINTVTMYVVKVVKNLHLYLKLITKIEITNVPDVFTYFRIPYLWLLHSAAFWQCLC